MQTLLQGLRVIEGSAFIAAPLGGMTLAQLGADVIRFDALGGGLDADRWPVTREGVSLYWAGLNKGKRSIAVDLRSPEGREILTRLITAPGGDAGIFSTNLPAKGWLAYDKLKERREDLIALNIVGSHKGTAEVDYTVNAVTGFTMITGPAAHEGPINQVLPAWDIATGYAAAMAILAAERHRSRTGKGQRIELPLQNVALSAVAAMGFLGEAEINGEARPRLGNLIYGTFGRDFRTKDGRYVMICMLTERQVDAVKEAGGLAEAFARIERETGLDLYDEAHRWQARERIVAAIEPWVASLTLAEVSERLAQVGALWGPYKSPMELVAGDPLLTENPMFRRLVQPGVGEVWSAGSPLRFAAADYLPARPAPRLGEHTDEILSGILGMADGEIARLHDKGIVKGAART
jgi:2-methylfumaryl-CoA isomerase